MQPDEVLDYPLPGRIPGRGALWARFGDGENALVVLIALGRARRRLKARATSTISRSE